jgi:hypothetical protein
MTFNEAVLAAKEGKRVTREDWQTREKSYWITQPLVSRRKKVLGSLYLFNSKLQSFLYFPPPVDKQANDWIIIPEEEKEMSSIR